MESLTLSELASMSSDDKDEMILTLRSKLKQCQNHRGNRIDVETFAKFESELKIERDQVVSLKRELEKMKRVEMERIPSIPDVVVIETPIVHPPSPSLSQPVVKCEVSTVSTQTEALETAAPLVNSFSQTDAPASCITSCVDSCCQTEIVEKEELVVKATSKPVQSTPIVPFIVPNFTDADNALIFEELTSLHCILRDLTSGGSEVDDVWKHSCSCGFFAALSSLRRRGEECRAEVETMRSMTTALLDKKTKKAKKSLTLPPVDKNASLRESGKSKPPSFTNLRK